MNYKAGGKVHSDKKEDVALMKRHNRLMHAGQKSKLASGGAVKTVKGAGAAIKGKKYHTC
jgi:hypothetical protein